MPPVVINLRHSDDHRDVVHRAVQALAEGKVVAFPTETVYGLAASSLHGEAVKRLFEIKGRQASAPLALALKCQEDALDFVPDASPLAVRLGRRCWPGPLTLIVPDDHPDSATKQLPEPTREAVCPSGTLGLRVPNHPLIQSVLRLTSGPLALTSANLSGQPDAVTAQQVVEALGDKVDLILDDGTCHFGQPSTVVLVQENRLRVLREGVLTAANLQRLSSLLILLVCTGNTCRSPMAMALLRKRAAEMLGCKVDQLEDRGVMILSAGIAAAAGVRPSPEAVSVMSERDIDLSRHESTQLSQRLVRFADVILTMTRGHREALIGQWPEATDRVSLLCHDGRDVADPIGAPPEVYAQCADQIDGELAKWMEVLPLDAIAQFESGD